MAELGLDDIGEIKAAIAAKRAGDDAKKTAEERAVEAATKLSKAEQEAAEYKAVLTQRATAEFALLTQEQQDAVVAIAGDSAAARLKAITALAPTWKSTAPITVEDPKTVAGAAAVTPPATTAPQPSAPPAAGQVQLDHKSQYEQLKKTNPLAAAHYLRLNERQIYPRG